MSDEDTPSFDLPAYLSRIGNGKSILHFSKNEAIFTQGDVADSFFYIQKGRVKITVLSEHGKEAVVAIMETGHFFGEGCLNGHSVRVATTISLEDSVITSISKKATLRSTRAPSRGAGSSKRICVQKLHGRGLC